MEKINVAVIDSGINLNHEFLKESVNGGISISVNEGKIIYDSDYSDQCGHGTACCSVIKNECYNANLYIVKILDSNGKSSLMVLEKALEYLLYIDVRIINLSLSITEKSNYNKIITLCKQLQMQKKILVCSLANNQKYSMPAILNDVIGVRGYILEEEGGFWFNRKKRIQCIMDSNPHMHCDLQNGYRLFGKSNSYASARVTGIISDFLIKNPTAEIKDIYNYLQKQSCRKRWNMFSFNKSKRFPEFGDISEINNLDLLNKIVDIVMEQQQINDRDIIFEYSLFDLKIGINDINSYYLIKRIEELCDIKIENYTKITRYDFFSIYKIVSFTEKILDQCEKR